MKHISDLTMEILENESLQKFNYMISWREKKIKHLERVVRSLENEIGYMGKLLIRFFNINPDSTVIINKDEFANQGYPLVDIYEDDKNIYVFRVDNNGKKEIPSNKKDTV